MNKYMETLKISIAVVFYPSTDKGLERKERINKDLRKISRSPWHARNDSLD